MDAWEWIDASVTRVAARLGRLRPLHLDVYRSYGTVHRFYVKGRLLADRGLTPQTDADSPWRNFQAMYRRFNSREIPGAEVLISLPEHLDLPVTTGPTGYFTLSLDPPVLPPAVDYLWHPVPVRLHRLPRRFRGLLGQVEGVGQVLIPPPTAEFGVISDLDDTVIVTRATHLLRMLRTVLLRNAYSHETLAGVAAFYQALLRGQSGRPDNPFFYVSFLALEPLRRARRLFAAARRAARPAAAARNPAGPHARLGGPHCQLRRPTTAISSRKSTRYWIPTPTCPSCCWATAGSATPDIYAEVARTHPGRIRVIYASATWACQPAPPACRPSPKPCAATRAWKCCWCPITRPPPPTPPPTALFLRKAWRGLWKSSGDRFSHFA
ncbi:MAG: phosphatase domain-containing protein [Hymenobacter sp.]